MGINSGNTKVWNHVYPRGLTIAEYKSETSLPKLFLGDLSAVGFSGYGLYSDNVYLNGSLTTKTKNSEVGSEITPGTYAGINTISGVSAIKDKVGSDKNIIFWAGSSSTEEDDIRQSPF
jgi:hypothetical protein